MAPEVALGAALAALQMVIGGILLWLVSRVGALTESQNEMNGNYRVVAEWKGTHDRQDDQRHAELRTEFHTRFEEVEKLRNRVAELEFQSRLHGAAS